MQDKYLRKDPHTATVSYNLGSCPFNTHIEGGQRLHVWFEPNFIQNGGVELVLSIKLSESEFWHALHNFLFAGN